MLSKRNAQRKSRLLLAIMSLGMMTGYGAFSMQENVGASAQGINSTVVKEQTNQQGIQLAAQEREHPTGVSPPPIKKGKPSYKGKTALGKC